MLPLASFFVYSSLPKILGCDMQVIYCSMLLILMSRNLKIILRRHTVALYYFRNNNYAKLHVWKGNINVGNREIPH